MRHLFASLVLIAAALLMSNPVAGADDPNKSTVVKKTAGVRKSDYAKTRKTKKESGYAAIEAAVKAGKLTKAEAAAKLAALKKPAPAKGGKSAYPKGARNDRYDVVAKKLFEFAEAGLLSKEQVQAMLNVLQNGKEVNKPK